MKMPALIIVATKGARSSVNAVKVIGEGIKAGSEEVNKWFHDLGNSIKDIERKL
jgi:hypothetical protein